MGGLWNILRLVVVGVCVEVLSEVVLELLDYVGG